MDPESEVRAYYDRGEERDRLSAGVGWVEFERTKEILARHLPAAPATVADVGGGPGRYAVWLAQQGYDVVHRDLVSRHVDETRALAEASGVRVDAAAGDARRLDLADGSVDAVLLLGPLYHLPDQHDRIAALREAARIVRDGGYVFAAAISRWAARLGGILTERIYEQHPVVLEIIDDVERSGRLAPLHEASFAGYTHRPDELRGEVVEAGLEAVDLVNVEGLSFAVGDLDELLSTELGRTIVLDAARAVERVPELLGLGPHLVVTARLGS